MADLIARKNDPTHALAVTVTHGYNSLVTALAANASIAQDGKAMSIATRPAQQ
jgi:hypothetical protein